MQNKKISFINKKLKTKSIKLKIQLKNICGKNLKTKY